MDETTAEHAERAGGAKTRSTAEEEAGCLERAHPMLSNGLRMLEEAATALAEEREWREATYAVLHLLTAVEVVLRGWLAMDELGEVWAPGQSWDANLQERGAYEGLGLHRAFGVTGARCWTDLEAGAADLRALEHVRNRALRSTDENHDSLTGLRIRALPVLDLLLAFLETDVIRPLIAREHDQRARAARRRRQRVREATVRIRAAVDARRREIARTLERYAEVTVRCPYCGQFAVPADGYDIECLLCGHDFGSASHHAAWDLAPRAPSWRPERCALCDHESILEDVPVAARPDAEVTLCLYDGVVMEGPCARCRRYARSRSAEFLCRGCAGETLTA